MEISEIYALVLGRKFRELFFVIGIISSLVKDVIMPPIGMLMGGVDFSNLFISLKGEFESLKAAVDAGAPVIKYGVFVQTTLDFLIVAFAIFMVVKGMNAAKKKEEAKPAAPAPTPEDVQLLREIRDALKK